jgi:chemotaxis protein CheX
VNVSEDDICSLSADVWSSILGLEAVPAGTAPSAVEERTLTGCVHISGGPWEGTVSLECPTALATAAAAAMFGMEPEELSREEIDDALGELANMTGGGVKALVPGPSALSLPTVVEGLSYSVTVPGSDLIREVVLGCEGSQFVVRVYQRRGTGTGTDAGAASSSVRTTA